MTLFGANTWTFTYSKAYTQPLYHPDVQISTDVIGFKNITVFAEKTDVPYLPNHSVVVILIIALWPQKLGQGQQNLTNYWSGPNKIDIQTW